MAPSSPTVARWELALRLRQRRKELDVDVKTITGELGFTRNYWSAVENERAMLADDKFEALLTLFKFDDAERRELRALRDEARGKGWWSEHGDRLGEDMLRLLGLEHGATRIRAFESLVIPGLLQTEEYAKEVIGCDPQFSEVEIDDLVRVRQRRQGLLTGDDALNFTAVMSEAALAQQRGRREVLRDQLDHLADLIVELSDSLAVHVLRFTTSPGALVGSSTLLLLDFASPSLPRLGWQEAIRLLGFVDDESQVRRLDLCFDQGLELSLGRDASLELIQQRSRELSRTSWDQRRD